MMCSRWSHGVPIPHLQKYFLSRGHNGSKPQLSTAGGGQSVEPDVDSRGGCEVTDRVTLVGTEEDSGFCG